MATPNINDEMRQTAEYAIKIARERFGKQLDYSEGSLTNLEYIIEQAHQQFNANKVEGKISNDAALNRTASIWGSYLGELIREKLGGTWIIEESKRWVVVNGLKFSPIDYVYQRITGQLQGNVKEYFDDVYIKLSSQPINFLQPEPNLPNSAYTSNQSQTEPRKAIVQPQNISENKNKSFSIERILQIVLGVAVLFLIVVAASWLYSSKISAPASARATQQAANVVATAIHRVYKTPTKIPSPSPTQIRYTPTPTEDINCKSTDVKLYLTAVSEILTQVHDEILAVSEAGMEDVLSSPSASAYMANLTAEHYRTASNIVPPICLKTSHGYLLEFLRNRYNLFVSASNGDYNAAIDFSDKADEASSLYFDEVKKVTSGMK